MVKSFLCILKCNHSSLQNNYSTQETISTCGELVIVCNDHTTLAIIIVAWNVFYAAKNWDCVKRSLILCTEDD